MGCACAQIVRSLAGHDRGGLFCVLDTDGPYLLHPVLDQLRTGGNLSNRDIRRALAAFRAEELRRV